MVRVVIAIAAAGSLVACTTKAAAPVISEEQAATEREACKFKRGALVRDTVASSWPTGDDIPIDHIVLVMQENRSFDHYFSKLTVPGQTVDGAADDLTNPAPDGSPVSRFHSHDYCFTDTNHAWDGTHDAINGGRMDGFAKANAVSSDPTGARALGYFDESDLPFYYWLARTFAVSDRHFCSLPGPTMPNRLYFMGGSSYGMIANPGFPPDVDANGDPIPNLLQELQDAGVAWKAYCGGILCTAAAFSETFAANQQKFVSDTDFFADAAAGTLPSVSIVETDIDEHPSADMQKGQRYVAKVVDALIHSPNWPKTALFFTYDEGGGLHDHVPPPAACKPDDIEPFDSRPGATPPKGSFDQLGVRVPMMVVSPYAKHGYVSHRVTDHTSITRFVEARFNLPAMTRRDANAEPPYDMFDFAHPITEVPTPPEAVVAPGAEVGCN